MESMKLQSPVTKIIVERVHWEALAPILTEWLGFYPSLKAVTPAVMHAALTCYLADAPEEGEKPTGYEAHKPLTVEAYNGFLQILLGRHYGTKYQSPGEGGLMVDSDGNRIVWFASHMRGREIQVRKTSYGWRAEFIFGQDGSINAASRAFAVATDDGYGYAVAYGLDGHVVAQADFLSGAPAPRKGWDWLPFHLKEEAEYLLDYLGDSLPEVTKAVANALLERAMLDQKVALAKLTSAASE